MIVSIEEYSKEIDRVIELEMEIKKIIKNFPHLSKERNKLDIAIREWRKKKKKGLAEYRKYKRNPKITP